MLRYLLNCFFYKQHTSFVTLPSAVYIDILRICVERILHGTGEEGSVRVSPSACRHVVVRRREFKMRKNMSQIIALFLGFELSYSLYDV